MAPKPSGDPAPEGDLSGEQGLGAADGRELAIRGVLERWMGRALVWMASAADGGEFAIGGGSWRMGWALVWMASAVARPN